MNKLMRIHELDNVLVAKRNILPGEEEKIDGEMIRFEVKVGIGQKIAAKKIIVGEKIIKLGIPIGSATRNISKGAHVHLHNLKSDYLSTYTLDDEFIKSE